MAVNLVSSNCGSGGDILGRLDHQRKANQTKSRTIKLFNSLPPKIKAINLLHNFRKEVKQWLSRNREKDYVFFDI